MYFVLKLPLCHIFFTGQGVVIENSVWADAVYADTLYKLGYTSRNGKFVTHEQTTAGLSVWVFNPPTHKIRIHAGATSNVKLFSLLIHVVATTSFVQ